MAELGKHSINWFTLKLPTELQRPLEMQSLLGFRSELESWYVNLELEKMNQNKKWESWSNQHWVFSASICWPTACRACSSVERNQNKSEGHRARTGGPYTLPQGAGLSWFPGLWFYRGGLFSFLKTYRSTTQEETYGWMDWPQAHTAPLTRRIH